MRFNLEAAPAKFAELAHVVGAGAGAGAAPLFVPWLALLKRSIGIAPSLAAVGVKREQFARLVEIATNDMCHQTNPRVCSSDDFQRFFSEAF